MYIIRYSNIVFICSKEINTTIPADTLTKVSITVLS